MNGVAIAGIQTFTAGSTIGGHSGRLVNQPGDGRAGRSVHTDAALIAFRVIDSDPSGCDFLQQPCQGTDRTNGITERAIQHQADDHQDDEHHDEGCIDVPVQQLEEIDGFVHAVGGESSPRTGRGVGSPVCRRREEKSGLSGNGGLEKHHAGARPARPTPVSHRKAKLYCPDGKPGMSLPV